MNRARRLASLRIVRAAGAAALGSLLGSALPASLARAEDATDAASYPDRPIRLIVTFPAGTTVDALARLIGSRLEASFKQTVLIDNRPGVSGNIGNELAAKAAPDGYTLVIAGLSLVTLPTTLGRQAVDPIRAFAPVIKVASAPLIILVNPSLGIDSLPQLVAEARRRPNELTYSTVGIGTPPHLAAVSVLDAARIELLHVPYGSSSTLIRDLLSGEVPLSFGYPTGKEPYLRSGQLKALAVTSARRLPWLPDVPTVAELGYPGFEVAGWFGILAPAGTPPAIVGRLNQEIGRALELPDVRSMLSAQGIEPAGGTPEQFADYLKSELARWTPVVKASGLRLQ